MTPPTDQQSGRSITVVRILGGFLAAALLAGIMWASVASNVVDGLRHLAGDRWGLVTLLDVYAGAFVVAVWMRVCERSWGTWLAWVLALLCLGHLVSLAYLLKRSVKAGTLVEVFTPGEHPPGVRRDWNTVGDS